MSRDPKINLSVPSADAPRPCAFYQAAMPASHIRRNLSVNQTIGGLNHRCMLNPGRATGPDGEEVGPLVCSLERQGICQAHRRSNMARLYATLPLLAPIESAQA